MREPAPGVEFGRYVMVGHPEHYGAGSLVAAREARSGARRNVWLVMSHVVEAPETRARLVKAATALRRLESPHLVQLHEFGEIEGQPFFATGPLDGVDLAQACTPDGVPPADALDLVAQIGTGVNHLHHAGLVEGALSPQRILVVEDDGRVHATVVHAGLLGRLLDSSALFDAQQREALDFGAPEVRAGAEPSIGSDVYSLGCLLWFALTGEAPFTAWTGRAPSAVPQVAGDGPVEEAVNSVLQRALAPNPEERYRDAAAFVATIRSIAALAREGAGGVLPERLTPRTAGAPEPELPVEEPELPVAEPELPVAEPPAVAARSHAADVVDVAAQADPERALRAAEEHWASGRPVPWARSSRRRRRRTVRTGSVLAGIAVLAVLGTWAAQRSDLLDAGGTERTPSAAPDATPSTPTPDPLSQLFPIAGKGTCTPDKAQVAHRIERWTCERRGYRVVLTHWDSHANARALVAHGGPEGAREPWVLGGSRTGTQWTWHSAAGARPYRWTAVYAEVPYAVIIEAKNRARRHYARTHVVIHPSTVLG